MTTPVPPSWARKDTPPATSVGMWVSRHANVGMWVSRHANGSAACYGRSDHGSRSSTSAASSKSKRRQGNHNQFQTLKMFPDGHLGRSRQVRFIALRTRYAKV